MSRDDAWIQTYTGLDFGILSSDTSQVRIEDIAHSLSNLCRFNGHCDSFYSVAQHSVIVSNACPGAYKLYGLLHDAHEAYLGDMVRPLKHLIPEYGSLCSLVQSRILQSLGVDELSPADRELLKITDDVVMMAERRDLMKKPPRPWLPQLEILGTSRVPIIVPWTAEYSKDVFLGVYQALTRNPS